MKATLRNGAIEISIIGKLDMATARRFEADFFEKYLPAPENVIGLNMSELKFLDSSGLSILMKITNAAMSNGKLVYYIALSSTILSVIKVARLDNLLHFMSEEEFNQKYPAIP
ncbi:MAG: STAS domain-containing protein [Spirochaetia bacterium]|nr:STAS domain-containing protein [Spirochaetia bacterium]